MLSYVFDRLVNRFRKSIWEFWCMFPCLAAICGWSTIVICNIDPMDKRSGVVLLMSAPSLILIIPAAYIPWMYVNDFLSWLSWKSEMAADAKKAAALAKYSTQ